MFTWEPPPQLAAFPSEQVLIGLGPKGLLLITELAVGYNKNNKVHLYLGLLWSLVLSLVKLLTYSLISCNNYYP